MNPIDAERLGQAISNVTGLAASSQTLEMIVAEYHRLDPFYQRTLPTAADIRGILTVMKEDHS